MIEAALIDRVARLTLNRPEKRNALNSQTCRDILKAFARAEDDPATGAILVCGNGPAFCSGMDLSEVLRADQNELVDLHERLFTTIQRARKPIIAAVQGAALAAGMGLAANAHIVVAGKDANFGLTEIRVGLWPVIVFRAVVRAIGERRATELSLTGRTMDADEALRCGLVTQVANDPQTSALEVARKLARFSPTAMAAGLDHAQRIRGLEWTEAVPICRRIRAELMASEDFNEGVRAFLEKRPADWPSLRSQPSD
jgi:enoyl-CoA hydratase/carnithine racemase